MLSTISCIDQAAQIIILTVKFIGALVGHHDYVPAYDVWGVGEDSAIVDWGVGSNEKICASGTGLSGTIDCTRAWGYAQ